MNALKKWVWLAAGWLLLSLSLGAQASAYDDFLNRDAWWQDRTPSGPITPPPGAAITPNGWEHFYPINVPVPTAWGAGNTLVKKVELNSMGVVNGKLMQKYTCDGEGLSLPVNWSVTTEQVCATIVNPNYPAFNVPANCACSLPAAAPGGSSCTATCTYDEVCQQNTDCSITVTDATLNVGPVTYVGCITAVLPANCTVGDGTPTFGPPALPNSNCGGNIPAGCTVGNAIPVDNSNCGGAGQLACCVGGLPAGCVAGDGLSRNSSNCGGDLQAACCTSAQPACCTNCGGAGQPACTDFCGAGNFVPTVTSTTIIGTPCDKGVAITNPALVDNPAKLDNTTNFALLLKNTTAGGFHQWAAYNIPFKTNSIGENTPKQVFADLFFQAINDYGNVGYGPPCPANGATDNYELTLYALRTPVNNSDPARYTAVQLENDLLGNDTVNSQPRQTPNGSITLAFTYTRGGDSPDLTNASPITLTAGDFTDGAWLPSQYTCDGPPEGYSTASNYVPPPEAERLNNPPSLSWQYRPAGDKSPAGTRSYVMLARDLTAHDPNGLWVVYDIPSTASSLTGHSGVGITGRNDWGGIGYRGPCPDTGDGLHYIEFHLYAMDVPSLRELDPSISIDQRNPSTFKQVEALVHDHYVDQTSLLGLYGRPPSNGLFRITSPAFANNRPLPALYRSNYQFPYYTLDTTQTTDGATSDTQMVVAQNRDQPVMTCFAQDGQNVSPPLQWANAPAGTLSYVLVLDDESADWDGVLVDWPHAGQDGIRVAENGTHWLAYDISPSITSLPENVLKNASPGAYLQGLNTAPWGTTPNSPQAEPVPPDAGPYGTLSDARGAINAFYDEAHYAGYWGPCLPLPTNAVVTQDHNYRFSLYALDTATLGLVPGATYAQVIAAMSGHILGAAEVLRTCVHANGSMTEACH